MAGSSSVRNRGTGVVVEDEMSFAKRDEDNVAIDVNRLEQPPYFSDFDRAESYEGFEGGEKESNDSVSNSDKYNGTMEFENDRAP